MPQGRSVLILGEIGSKVKVKDTKRSKTYFHNSESTGPNLMKFGGMIGHDQRNNRLDFGRDRVKGQGHEKVKNVFPRYIGQYAPGDQCYFGRFDFELSRCLVFFFKDIRSQNHYSRESIMFLCKHIFKL